MGEGQGRWRAVGPPINPLIEGEGVGGTPIKWEGASEREGGLQGEKGGSSGGLFKIFMFYFALFSLVAGNWRASYWKWSGEEGRKIWCLGVVAMVRGDDCGGMGACAEVPSEQPALLVMANALVMLVVSQ